MEYLLSALLFALNLLRHQYAFNQYIFLFGGLTLFCALFFACYKKSSNFIAACLMMLCHTWPYSWTNIFGSGTENLQLPWFYIVGALILGYFFLNIKKVVKREVNTAMLISTAVLIVLLIYPLLLSKSLTEGLKELLMLYFFLILVFVGLLFSSVVPYNCRKYITGALIFACTLSGGLLILQRLMFSVFSISLFKVSSGIYFGSTSISVKLLMEDASSATIMLGCGVFYLLERIEIKKGFLKIPYMLCVIIVLIGMGFTTRRTSVLTLAIVLVLYALFHYKNVFTKIGMGVVCFALGAVAIWYLSTSRSVTNMEQLFYENGRFSVYIDSLKIFAENPFGIGYDNNYLISLVGGIVPHNTIIRWLVMCGIVSTVLLVFIIFKILGVSYKKKLSCEFWAILYSFVASNFIPDILTARFFVILCISVLFLTAENSPEIKMLEPNVINQ